MFKFLKYRLGNDLAGIVLKYYHSPFLKIKLNKQERTQLYKFYKSEKFQYRRVRNYRVGLTYLVDNANKWYVKPYNKENDDDYFYDDTTSSIYYIKTPDGIRKIYSELKLELKDYYIINQSDAICHTNGTIIIIRKSNKIDF